MVLINRKIVCEEERVGWNVGQWKWAEFEGVNLGTPETTTREVRLLLDYERVCPALQGRSQLSLRLLCQDPSFLFPHLFGYMLVFLLSFLQKRNGPCPVSERGLVFWRVLYLLKYNKLPFPNA